MNARQKHMQNALETCASLSTEAKLAAEHPLVFDNDAEKSARSWLETALQHIAQTHACLCKAMQAHSRAIVEGKEKPK